MLTNCSEIEPLFGGMTYIQISIMVCVRLPWVPFWVPFWVPEVFLACGGNFRCWPKPRARVTIKTWQKPETGLEKSLAPRVSYPNCMHWHDVRCMWMTCATPHCCCSYCTDSFMWCHKKLWGIALILNKKRTHVDQLTSLVEVRVFHWRSLLAVVLTPLVCQLAVWGNPFLSIRWQNSVQQRIISQ